MLNLNKYLHLIVIIFLVTIYTIKFNGILFTPVNIDDFAKKYSQSQYIMGDSAVEKVSDSELYVYASYAYIRGEDPTTINFEHPPLIKYLYGFSYLLFNNQYTINIFLYIGLLYTFYIFSGTVLTRQKSKVIALFIFGSIPLLTELIKYALLDLWIVLSTLILFILTFKKTINKPLKNYILIGITLGIIASIKYPIPFILLPIAFVFFNSLIKNQVKYFLISIIMSAVVYLAQYIIYFRYNHSFIDFINFEKYRLNWWIGDRTVPKFLIFSNLFFGKYKAWWVENMYQYSREWNLGIPALFLLHIYAFFKIHKNVWEYQLFVYSSLLLALFALGSASELRYLLQLLPIWIVLSVKYIENRKIVLNQ